MLHVTLLSLITSSFLFAVNGADDETFKRLLDRSVSKRSHGLIRDLVNLLVEEKRERENLMKENNATKAMLNKIKMEFDATKQMVIKYKKASSRHLMDIQTTVNSILNKPGVNRTKNMHTVGFTAMICCNNFKDNEIMRFSNVKTMYGDDYNTKTGIFVCSKPGMYYFHVIVVHQQYRNTYIVKDGKKMTYSYGGAPSSSESTSAGLVVRLEVGDKVWVQSAGKSYFGGESHFSGMLITE